VVEWRAKVFIQKHVVMRADVVLCVGVETRAFVNHPSDDPSRIKAIPVPEDIKALCT
jgi:4-hydroxybenzoyl-CoA thioesterase